MEEGFFFFRNVEISSFFSTSLHSNLFFLRVQFLRRSTVEATQGKGCIFTERAERFKILILEDRGKILLGFDFFSFLFFLVARMRCREWRKDFFFVMLKLVLFYFSFEFILFKSFQFLKRSAVEAIQRKGCIFTERAERF